MDSKVTMLAVGQGAMNLIEIYDVIAGRRVLVNLSLIDCGSIDGHRASQAVCERALGYAAEKMQERYILGEHLLLDNLLLTHKDGDHWNLLNRLFKTAIGVDTALISEYFGYLSIEEPVDFIENYYMNRLDEKFEHEINYYGECEIESKFSYIEKMHAGRTEMSLEYTYGNSYMFVCWGPESLCISASCVNTSDKLVGDCLNGEYVVWRLGMEEQVRWEKPSGYEGFVELFFAASGILQMIRETAIYMPDEHVKLIKNILNNINVGKKKIESATMNNLNHVFPFIQNLYIGGNSDASSKKFSALKKTLKMFSQRYVVWIAKRNSIELYGGIRLYIIEKLTLSGLRQVPGAEPVSSPSIKNNATSIVSVLLRDKVPEFEKIVFTGDATVHTFYQMLLDINTDMEQGKTVIYQNAAWTAPHHGAYKTIHGVIPDNPEGREVFPALLGAAHPIKMVVSAGVANMHGHPCKSFMDLVENYFKEAGLQAIPHDIYRNTNDKNKGHGAAWEFASTDCPFYTTYTILQDGSKGYMDYAFSFPPQNAVPAENMLLLENRAEPAGRVFDSTAIPVKAEIPSKNMFFHR